MALKRYAYSELHVSTTSGFTPSAATLAAVSKSGTFSPANLTPGTTYYYRILHRDLRGLVGQATPEQSFVAGYTQLGHIDPTIRQNFLAYCAADANFSGDADYVVPLDTTDYDSAAVVDKVNHRWSFPTDGWFTFMANAEISATLPADTAKLVLQNSTDGGTTWNDVARAVGNTAVVIAQHGIVNVLEPTLITTIPVAAGTLMRFVIRALAVSTGRTWTMIIPSTSIIGTFIRCTQELSPV